MRSAISGRRYLRRKQASYARPLVFCCELDGITDDAISMNVAIARRLADVSPSMTSMRLESCFVAALSDLPEGVVIRDIDALFNPAYEVVLLHASKERLVEDERFSIGNSGREFTVSLREG